MSTVLVTGGTGFVGRSLIPALTAAQYNVRCAVKKKVEGLLNCEQVCINSLDEETDWSHALEGVDVVIHLAARVHVLNESTQSSGELYFKTNSLATKNLAEQAAAHQVKRFVFLSSIKVNGEFTQEGMPYTEESSHQPDDLYGQSKLYAEQYLKAISQASAMEVVILRSPLVYGPGVKANFLKMLHWVDRGFPLPFGRVKNKRSFIYINNLVSAICRVIVEQQAANQLYLVADDESLSLTELIRTMAKAMEMKIVLLSVPSIFLTAIFKVLGLNNLTSRLLKSLEIDNGKIKTQLGWSPPVSTLQGIRETVAWFKAESLKNINK